MPLSPGTDFGSYHLIRPLGQGGFAEVWEADSATTGRRVALKILTQLPASSSNALERFRQEGRLAAGLHHPRCVYVFDAGEVAGVPYISMELMPGGTLADKIRGGPLPVATAVDYVLDMLDGLEAAHAAGIIHRDIKPSNVFLDEQGRARLGDFGISKSLGSTAALTQTAAFLGTPQYASPEQAGGETVDSRSDLYSAGTVLYELLTGESPYGAENPAQALARVLTQAPPPFPARVAVPRGLQRVVYRLLAKQKEKRYQTSAAARDALAPYSSRGVTTAELARRFGAIAVDLVLLSFIGMLLGGFSFRHQLASQLIQLGAMVIYFTVLEGLGRMSVGKRLAGLRVVTPVGGAPQLRSVALRSTIFVLLYLGPSVAIPLLGLPTSPLIPAAALALAIGIIVSTMRRANGFAGVHEVLSGTRVVAVQRVARAGVVPDDPPATGPVPEPAPAFGPYRPTGLIWARQGEAVYVAHDDELRRDVWIHVVPADGRSALPSTDELRARNAGYLPWLQRGETAGAVWDAYGAPRGVLLERWAARGPIGWGVTRRVLLSLGQALNNSGRGALTTSHVWVDRSGHAQLLDFPLDPDAGGRHAEAWAPDDTARTRSAIGGSPFRVSPPNWQDFMRQVTALGLTGRSGHHSGPPPVPLPVHARTLLRRLWGDGAGYANVADFVAALEHAEFRPAVIPQARRVATLLIPAVWPALIMLVTLIQSGSRYPAWFQDLIQDRPFYVKALQDSLPPRSAKDSIEIVLSGALSAARATPRLGEQMLSFMSAADRALIDTLAQRHPGVTSQHADTARAWLSAHRTVWMDARDIAKLGLLGRVAVALLQLGTFGIAAVILALILRGPPLLHLAGISVTGQDGAPAGRLRCAVRSAVAWSPWIALFFAHRAPFAVQIALAALGAAGVAYSFANPDRGVPDRVIRTVLVPK